MPESSQVKSLLCSAPVLTAPCFDHPLVLQVDASHVGAGAVLMQADEQGVDRACFDLGPAAFCSICGVWGDTAVVYTDHNPLTFLHIL